MYELVLFRDTLDENPEPEFGILTDRDEPDVVCLGCGSTIEFGDYEIIKRLPWIDLSEILKKMGAPNNNLYLVCIDSSFIRDAQFYDFTGIGEDEFCEMDLLSSEYDENWKDIEPNHFVDLISASSVEDACNQVAQKRGYDARCLCATKII